MYFPQNLFCIYVFQNSGGLSALGTIMKDFRLELAKSGAAKCQVCEEKIKKGEVRAGKKNYESQRAKMYGPYDGWHHIPCFAEKREELEYFDAGEAMAGFMLLGPEVKICEVEVESLENPSEFHLES